MYFKQNTGNVVKILDAMRIHNVNKFIFSSTCATYGDHDEMPTTEDTGQIFGSNFPTRDGTCIRDYIHVVDLVDAFLAALKHLSSGFIQIFNSSTGVSVQEFVAAWLKVTGKQIKVEIHEEKRIQGDYAEAYCDPSKIEEEFKWNAKFTNLEDSLATAWN
ncbi:unnamed protein product [Sphagnum jensenii]|uniref:NAD-dependent epimerase/dehydratase domain-containing protein n=1 Tax=Sphagnum jensenii TaxID=128206 RepID=A0ABP1B515_9BRYO